LIRGELELLGNRIRFLGKSNGRQNERRGQYGWKQNQAHEIPREAGSLLQIKMLVFFIETAWNQKSTNLNAIFRFMATRASCSDGTASPRGARFLL
jgi:hypothetical protein